MDSVITPFVICGIRKKADITVDSAIDRIFSDSLFLHKKKQFYTEHDKNITYFITFIFYKRSVVKLDHQMTLFLNTVAKSTVI